MFFYWNTLSGWTRLVDSSSQSFPVLNASFTPLVYSGVTYDFENGARSEVTYKETGDRVRQTFPKTIDVWNGTTSWLTGSRTGYPALLTSKNEVPGLTPLPSGTIGGKYRCPNVIPTAYTKGFSTIKVRFTFKGEVFDYIAFTTGKEYRASGYKSETFGSDYTEIAFIKGNAPDVNVYTLDNNNITNYRGEIIEFATNQEVPQFFLDFMNANFEYIHPYTFTVKSQNGVEVLSSISEAPLMLDAAPSAVGKNKTLTLTGSNGQTYTMKWESETPAGKQFLGLAYGANETRASIPTGRTTPVTWDGSLTIYEAYGTYRPPVTTFDINLYQSSAEVNRVDKTNYLTGVGTLSGVLREECSIIAPSITFKQTTVPSFNYVYIAAFGRYYYVTGITSVSKDIWRMSLSCDVLMTWKDDIRALTAIIARQENSFNPLLLDSELPAQANQNITVAEFPAGGFITASESAYPFILIVVGA